MAKRARESSDVDPYGAARTQFNDVMQWLKGDRCPAGHAQLESDIEERVRELARQLFQGRMDRLFHLERERVLKGRKPPGEVRVRKRELETRFGRVTIRRHGFRVSGALATGFPLDRSLRLPAEIYSHGLRKLVAEEVRAQSVIGLSNAWTRRRLATSPSGRRSSCWCVRRRTSTNFTRCASVRTRRTTNVIQRRCSCSRATAKGLRCGLRRCGKQPARRARASNAMQFAATRLRRGAIDATRSAWRR